MMLKQLTLGLLISLPFCVQATTTTAIAKPTSPHVTQPSSRNSARVTPPSRPQKTTVIVKPRSPYVTPPTVTQPQKLELKYIPPIIAGKWTCYAFDAEGHYWSVINLRRKRAYHRVKHLCKNGSSPAKSCRSSKEFCFYGEQSPETGKYVLR